MSDREPMRFANAHRESRAVRTAVRVPGRRGVQVHEPAMTVVLGEDGPRTEKGASRLPKPPASRPHTVLSYVGDEVVDAIRSAAAPKRKRRKRRAAVAKKGGTA